MPVFRVLARNSGFHFLGSSENCPFLKGVQRFSKMFSFYANLRNLKCSSRFIFGVMGRMSRIKMKKIRLPHQRNPLEKLQEPLFRGSELFLYNGIAGRTVDSLEFLQELLGSLLQVLQRTSLFQSMPKGSPRVRLIWQSKEPKIVPHVAPFLQCNGKNVKESQHCKNEKVCEELFWFHRSPTGKPLETLVTCLKTFTIFRDLACKYGFHLLSSFFQRVFQHRQKKNAKMEPLGA